MVRVAHIFDIVFRRYNFDFLDPLAIKHEALLIIVNLSAIFAPLSHTNRKLIKVNIVRRMGFHEELLNRRLLCFGHL
jgi:hypothetical protein